VVIVTAALLCIGKYSVERLIFWRADFAAAGFEFCPDSWMNGMIREGPLGDRPDPRGHNLP
jgi:hypothetical protein